MDDKLHGGQNTSERGAAADALVARPDGGRSLDLLMDVELPVSVSFGKAQIPLKDALKLTSGSVVELDRSVGDLVDIVVNNCVIARGEVVVIENNFGVRVVEVASRQERVGSLC